jgi:hypothetical protein
MSHVLPKHFAVTVSESTATKMLAAAEVYSKVSCAHERVLVPQTLWVFYISAHHPPIPVSK